MTAVGVGEISIWAHTSDAFIVVYLDIRLTHLHLWRFCIYKMRGDAGVVETSAEYSAGADSDMVYREDVPPAIRAIYEEQLPAMKAQLVTAMLTEDVTP